MAKLTKNTTAEIAKVIHDLNLSYETYHKSFETNFWATKMNLKGNSVDELTRTKQEYERFLRNTDHLQTVKECLQSSALSPEQRHVLKIMEKTFLCYASRGTEADKIRDTTIEMENALAETRNKLQLGFTDPTTKQRTTCSSVFLREKMKTSESEAIRKSCWDGLRSIGPCVCPELVEIVKMRNKYARSLGYIDFYEYKVQTAEGFGKDRLFSILDELEKRTRPLMEKSRKRLSEEKGVSALEPYNLSHAVAGDSSRDEDPYFPFEEAIDRFGRTFAALGINYRNATLNLDLLDREGKYPNGFCHWPQPAWRDTTSGKWIPSTANFTSVASPKEVGSGQTALTTLLHEAGHAAHYANIDQPSPLFAQERPPSSVAYAELQSMFLDSLATDSAWLVRYAFSRQGEVMPWSIIEKNIQLTQPYAVFMLRAMLAVPYFEKALYEMPDNKLSSEAIQALADQVEIQTQGGLASRPLLSVPHILDDESSCYYHGYILAEMAVHHTRKYFLTKYGRIADNPKVGPELTEVYWKPGNGEQFLDVVEKLTGKPLSSEAYVEELQESVEEKIHRSKKDYEEGLKVGPVKPRHDPTLDLGMRLLTVHGDEAISDSQVDGGFTGASNKFSAYVKALIDVKATAKKRKVK